MKLTPSLVSRPHQRTVSSRPPRALLRDFNESSVGLFLTYWYHPPDYWKFLEFSERLFLRVIENFEAENIPFATPALTVHMDEKTVPKSD